MKIKFWGCWNQLPIPENAITQTWLKKPDEQLSNTHLLKKTLSRLFFLYLTGQRSKWYSFIPKNTQRILWLHISDNLGDSLMRLAPVQLLKNYQVDLYTTGCATQLFIANSYFNQVYTIDTDAEVIKQQQYDLVILDAVQTNPLKKKLAVARATPFVTLHELFHFCRDDYNPIYFTWWRMQYLLREHYTAEMLPHLVIDITSQAQQKIAELNIPENSIAIAVGGRETYRTYKHWSQVVALLQQQPYTSILLLGSENGAAIAAEISNQYSVKNYVAQFSLTETAAIIQQCTLLLCADGGLLHIANAVNTKTISLFAEELPQWRYVDDDDYCAIRADEQVSDIPPQAVVELI
jgi:heptosyltransferase-2